MVYVRDLQFGMGEASIAIAAWGKDTFPVETEGFQPGEPIHFRIWQKSTNTEIEVVEVSFKEGDGLYYAGSRHVLSSLNAYKPPSDPLPVSPAFRAEDIPINVEFIWYDDLTSDTFNFQLGRDSVFMSIDFEISDLNNAMINVNDLLYDTVYYWRVQGVNRGGTGGWTQHWMFTTEAVVDSVVPPVPSDTLKIPISSSWNLVSSYIDPDDKDIKTIFSNIDDPELFVKDGFGNVYWPGNNINEIGSWDVNQSYMVYVNRADTIRYIGTMVEIQQQSIRLEQGWNYTAFFSPVPMDIKHAFSSLDDKLELVKTHDGSIYWPRYSANTVDRLLPGRGYQLYMKGEGLLLYPHIDGPSVTINDGETIIPLVQQVEDDEEKHYIPTYSNTGESAVLVVELDSLYGKGEIGVWCNEGELIGSGSVHDDRAVMVIWGNNVRTSEKIDGAIPGETLQLTFWSSIDSTEYDLTLLNIRDILAGDESGDSLRYYPEGIFIVNAAIERDEKGDDVDEGEIETPEGLPIRFTLHQNFPNPFNPSTSIRFSVPDEVHVNLAIYNVLGQEIDILVNEVKPPGNYEYFFDAANLPSGIYIYNLSAGFYIETKKMVLIR
jgi:hypothetical protein